MIEIPANEIVLRVVRKHWFVLVSRMASIVGLAIAPFLILAAIDLVGLADQIPPQGDALAGFLLVAWLLVVWMIGWRAWIDYELDALVITDKRIFNIIQNGFFRRESSAFRIDRIQDIQVEVRGIIETFLDFGTLKIQTASEMPSFTATHIGHPYDVKKFIGSAIDGTSDRPTTVVPLHPTQGFPMGARAPDAPPVPVPYRPQGERVGGDDEAL